MAVAARSPTQRERLNDPVLTVAAPDGAPISVHHLAGDRSLPPLLFSHATGFHAHCYLPVAELLADRFCSFGIDHRGHGSTPHPEGWDVDWSSFGTDTSAVAATLAPDGGLVGVGHSMGGGALLMAAAASPGRFARLVLFEPIVPPRDSGELVRDPDRMEELPIVQGARRRRRTFESIEAAIENYSTKPPLSLMTPATLRAYVEHGFRPTADGREVELRCSPDTEAGVFVSTGTNTVWNDLPSIEIPVTAISGAVEDESPARYVSPTVERLPHGTEVVLPHQTHFGPFSHPDEFASLIAG